MGRHVVGRLSPMRFASDPSRDSLLLVPEGAREGKREDQARGEGSGCQRLFYCQTS